MKPLVLIFICCSFLSSLWSQRIIDWNLIINDSQKDLFLYQDFQNKIEFSGGHAARIGIVSENSTIQKIGESFILIPNKDARQVKVLFTYKKRRKASPLGVMILEVKRME